MDVGRNVFLSLFAYSSQKICHYGESLLCVNFYSASFETLQNKGCVSLGHGFSTFPPRDPKENLVSPFIFC